MPDTLPYSSDPDIPHGSRVLTIDGVAYIANSFSVDSPTTELERNTALGAPNGFKLLERPRTGQAELQLETGSTLVPGRGTEFATSYNGDSVTFVVTQAGKPEQTDALWVANITFREKK